MSVNFKFISFVSILFLTASANAATVSDCEKNVDKWSDACAELWVKNASAKNVSHALGFMAVGYKSAVVLIPFAHKTSDRSPASAPLIAKPEVFHGRDSGLVDVQAVWIGSDARVWAYDRASHSVFSFDARQAGQVAPLSKAELRQGIAFKGLSAGSEAGSVSVELANGDIEVLK
ncbi:MAG: hypothetical protein JNL01_15120 [Bdellovibrionales bacterium]|nr:hypothetical protein [Bdellovibrionales bacterium]